MENKETHVFEVVVTHVDPDTGKKEIVFGPETFLAVCSGAASLDAARQIDKKYDSNDLQIIVRSFG